nr:hypothetical protein B0A51_03983 [Rachicladosporium sp. CCFEE 5018]
MGSAPRSSDVTVRRPIKKLLIANRGEIAKRIIDSARELSIETFALTTRDDHGHAPGAGHIITVPSSRSYLDIAHLVDIVRHHSIDAVHAGYGFLSESPDFARRMWEEAGAVVIGPGWAILERTGDKLAAKRLARECGVPTLPATEKPTSHLDDVRRFAAQIGYPVMLKAVDGGGGKGIRLVRQESELESAAKRAMSESPSHEIFVEKAAIDGFRHIEVQIISDGSGSVRHLWERECSVQRRFQKIVELAPSTIADRDFVDRILDAAVRMAKHVQYLSLGTFEFLANPESREFYFLEVNPRLQVEHTVTESIFSGDIVKAQLDIAQGATVDDACTRYFASDSQENPKLKSIQLRITAENVQSDWSLSIGRIDAFTLPTGNGIRVDTHLVPGQTNIIGSDFDSLLAKIIVTAVTWEDAVRKCRRALDDTSVSGVKTNIDVLRAIVAHPDFEAGTCDTSWLERNAASLLASGLELTKALESKRAPRLVQSTSSSSGSLIGSSNAAVSLRKGDAWALKISDTSAAAAPQTHHFRLTKVIRNEFPALLRAEAEYSLPGSHAPLAITLEATHSTASSGSVMAESKHRQGNRDNPRHVTIPFPGKLVELLVDEGDLVQPGQVICVVQQMKMELEVRASAGGRVVWITEAEDGEDVAEGTLAAELEEVNEDAVQGEIKSKL